MDMDRYWSKFLTDIPFLFILAAGIYVWGPRKLDSRVPETAIR